MVKSSHGDRLIAVDGSPCGSVAEALPRTLAPLQVLQMSDGFQTSSDTAVERFVGLNQILPSQYYDVSGGHRLTGEQRLMLALLADAINVYQ